ncbi:MAG: HAMP domain-containing histidine kinase [Planctomycetales bacterium]
MAKYYRKRSTLGLPITLNVCLMTMNIALMVCWIVLLAQESRWSALAIGTVLFVLILVGLSFYLALTVKEIRLNQRQANFVDSVTHELKTPLASIRLYLETLQMRDLEEKQQAEFYQVMQDEVARLDSLINQLLEVGRLDDLGNQLEAENVELEPLLLRCASAACAHHQQDVSQTVRFDLEPAVVFAPPLLLEMIFRNLLDNAVKYGADDPQVEVEVRLTDNGRVTTRVLDNGKGVAMGIRKKIFRLFYRGGDELQRERRGAGLGLYIVHTLVRKLKGKVRALDRDGQAGSVFEVELPGRTVPCAS